MINKRLAAAQRSNLNPSTNHSMEQHESNFIEEKPESDGKKAEPEQQSKPCPEMRRKPGPEKKKETGPEKEMRMKPCCCDKDSVRRGPWSREEDHKLKNFIQNHGIQCWKAIPELAGLSRCGKSCRLRWLNNLRPGLRKGKFSAREEDIIIDLQGRLGNRWSEIASHLPGRSDNEIKNHWHTTRMIKKRQQGLASHPSICHSIEPTENIIEEKPKSDGKHSEMKHQPIQQIQTVVVKSELQEIDPTLQNKQEAKEASVPRNVKMTTGAADDDQPSGIDMITYYNIMCRSLDMGLWLTSQESNHSIH